MGVTEPDRLQSVLSVDSITVRFGGVTALDDVSLDLHVGEVLGIIGPNGAGKTTLFDVISGVLAPSSGIVRLNTRDVSRERAVFRARRGIRRTFQRQQIFEWLTVEENVRIALDWRRHLFGRSLRLRPDPGVWPDQLAVRDGKDAIRSALSLCGLEHMASQGARSLPIGQARMLELARAIVDGPRVLLLDEPTSGLDSVGIGRLEEVIRRITNMGTAVLLVEHDVRFVFRRSDFLIMLDTGRVVEQGTPRALTRSPTILRAYGVQ
jgi:branched-chain amino acid transport system ATP-binding protein